MGYLIQTHKWLYEMIEFNGMIFKMGIKLFLVFSTHVFHTLIEFTDNHMHVNVFLICIYYQIVNDL